MQKSPISAIILTKNEQSMIVNCIETLRWCQEVIVIDSQSTDSTVQLAKRAGAMVYSTDKESFDQRRNYGLEKARAKWVLYIDADERVSPDLAQEIDQITSDSNISAIRFRRENIHYGREMKHGGWENDWVSRAFQKDALTGWTGKIHESPNFTGKEIAAKHPLIHFTHRNMVEGLYKTIQWTGFEAELLNESGHPPVTVTTLFRKTMMEFYRRAFRHGGRKDGIEGWIEAFVQAFNKFIVYERLWELQSKPGLEEKYQKLDKAITDLWREKDHA
jgi:glycosyltransferase involved in cell wall biosynthesis